MLPHSQQQTTHTRWPPHTTATTLRNKRMKCSGVLLCVVAIACVLFAAVNVEASQLRLDPSNPLRAYGNGTTYDISHVFQWPVAIENDPRHYSYWWNPTGHACPNTPNVSGPAVCQKADRYYVCGETDRPLWTLESTNPGLVFRITYTNGYQWRLTVFTFIVDENIHEPTIKFINENPYEQYNFEVRGKCIGNPSWGTNRCPSN
eukprot:TRINITY_DN14009_c0_g1_i1.p2 TRINITY_DN14009_c0_g1~~TRINITY_DN14009_c0_g1_i1.p2  ORF type:complete len:204 (-),score=30.63 TRINITY_DN14009_c0_g1_i1:31-642(-)